MSWARVGAWRDRLAASDAAVYDTGLSAEGARHALKVALAALHDGALQDVEKMEGQPFDRAHIIAAATVITAPLEWCAVLLGRGTSVTLKGSQRNPGLLYLFEETARAEGLPLTATTAREVPPDAALVIAMASDETLGELRKTLHPAVRLLPHGHRFSAAWVTGAALPEDPLVPPDFQDPWGRVAADAALHDGRGCLSPVVVFTPLPAREAAQQLGETMARAEAKWPRGRIDPREAAQIRAQRALARATGAVVEGAGWAVHVLPEAHWSPAALPRTVALVSTADPAALLRPWAARLSTISTDDPSSAPRWVRLGATRVCATGRSQRPPLLRPHDGEDWLRATLWSVSREI